MSSAAGISLAAPESDLKRWMDSARAGAKAVYASGPALPREAAGVKLARSWSAAGLVRLHQQRDPLDGGRWQFLMIKNAVPGADLPEEGSPNGSAACSAPVRHAVDRMEMKAMLALLTRCAERGEPCPSNRELARALNLRTRRVAQYLIERLQAEGKIVVQGQGPRLPRLVTIAKGRRRMAMDERKAG